MECYVCPLLYDISSREKRLYGDDKLYSDVSSLYDLRYWHDRNRARKKRELDRIKLVLGAWEKPAQQIEKTLGDNAKLTADANARLGTEPTKVVVDVFLRLVPMHLAIAPPPSSGKTTTIDRKYTEFCECDKGNPDDCCGPDVGVPTMRQRIIGPQPYLIRPGDYYLVICCLTQQRYLPAKDAWTAAESAYEAVDAEIKRLTADVDPEKVKQIEKNAKAAVPADCTFNKPPAEGEPAAR